MHLPGRVFSHLNCSEIPDKMGGFSSPSLTGLQGSESLTMPCAPRALPGMLEPQHRCTRLPCMVPFIITSHAGFILLTAYCNPSSFSRSIAQPAISHLQQFLPQALIWPFYPFFQITISICPDYFKKVFWFLFFPKNLQSLPTLCHLSV